MKLPQDIDNGESIWRNPPNEHGGIGIGNETIHVNEFGGKQSSTPFRFDLLRGIAAKAMFKLAGVLDYGARKYADDNWHNVSPQDHLNHALTHAFAWLAGDKKEDHVSHFHCRALMFAATLEDPRWNDIRDPLVSAVVSLLDRYGVTPDHPGICVSKDLTDDHSRTYTSEELRLKVEDFQEGGILRKKEIPGLTNAINKAEKETYGKMLNRHHNDKEKWDKPLDARAPAHKETYGEMLNRHHKENSEFSKPKETSEKEFFDTIYP